MNPLEIQYETSELKVYRLDDDYVNYYNSCCFCGAPGPIGDSPLEYIKASNLLDANPSSAYIVEVMGDSMIEADIKPGDKVVVDQQRVATDGDVVLALLEGQVLLKYYQHDEKGNVWLVPANPNHKPRMINSDYTSAEIIGVMVSLIRQRPKFDAVLRNRLDKAIEEEYKVLKTSAEVKKDIYKIMPNEIDKEEVLKILHNVIDGKNGVDVVKILLAAKYLNYITRLPSIGVLQNEFNVQISRSQYYRDKANRYFEEDLEDYIDALRGE